MLHRTILYILITRQDKKLQVDIRVGQTINACEKIHKAGVVRNEREGEYT